jgi:hypothetical protein
VHGLAQTEEYHRALMDIGPVRDQDWIEAQISLRQERQRRFFGRDGVRLTEVMAEAALTHRVGGDAVTKRQLEHLVVLAEQPGVKVWVLPIGRGGNPVLSTSFMLIEGPIGSMPTPSTSRDAG